MTNQRNASIELENVGPIEALRIPLPPDGGVVVLSGRNGSGKSTALEATASALRGKGQIPLRDGTLKGRVEVAGATIRIGKSTRRAGEAEVEHLEGRFSVADLVDPGIQSPEAADAKRIKALVTLTGAKPTRELFVDVFGEDAENMPLDAYGDDLVAAAKTAKRYWEEQARGAERLADTAIAKVAALRSQIEDVDLEAETDAEVLSQANQEAVVKLATLRERNQAAVKLYEQQEQARRWFAEHDSAQAVSIEAMESELDHLQAHHERTTAKIAELEEERRLAINAIARTRNSIAAAKQHAEEVASIQALLDREIDQPTEEELAEAHQAVQETTLALEQAAVTRKAAEKALAADGHEEEHKAHAALAAKYRDLAKATDELLERSIRCDSLRVKDGRLITTTGRGETYFADLSDGERWKIAIDIAADQVGENGLLVIEQSAWEGLDFDNRVSVARHAVDRHVTIITAEASRGGASGELEAVVYP